MLENNTFLDSIFEWIFFVLASENESKIEQFSHLDLKRPFCKNHCFRKENCYFSDSEPPEIHQNRMLKRIEK